MGREQPEAECLTVARGESRARAPSAIHGCSAVTQPANMAGSTVEPFPGTTFEQLARMCTVTAFTGTRSAAATASAVDTDSPASPAGAS